MGKPRAARPPRRRTSDAPERTAAEARRLLERQHAMQEELLQRRAEQSLRAYIEQAWPVLEPDTPFLPNWHIDLLCEYLEAVSDGSMSRLLINLPPRYGKSLLVSVLWPTWEWLARPGTRWLFVSHSETLATKHSVDRRAVLQSAWYRGRWGDRFHLTADHNLKTEFGNDRRGLMVATSVGGSVTGRGGNRLVLDDPHNPRQAESDLQREAALTFFQQTLSTRLDDKKRDAIVVVMQRLHTRDLAGLCLDLDYEHLCLPAEAEVRTTIRFPQSGRTRVRAVGEPLWPAREGPAELAAQRRLLGTYAYTGQYQQRPFPRGGAIFKREWWKYVEAVPPCEEIVQSWDLSFKDKPGSDWVVGLVIGRAGAVYYLLDRFKARASFSESCRAIEAMTGAYPQTRVVLVEDTANGPAVIDALRHHVPRLVPVTPQGGKLARAAAIEPLVEAGNVWLPNPRHGDGRLIPGRAWVDDFVETLAAFPAGEYDDDVDALSQGLNHCEARRRTAPLGWPIVVLKPPEERWPSFRASWDR